jgi:hypothetical protein
VGAASTAVGAAPSLSGSQLTAVGSAAPTGSISGGASGLQSAESAQKALAATSEAAEFIGQAAKNLV